ncbi:MAG: hypothetical protein KGL55_10930 [Rhodospirillales bacterium]|nr:hypothetical protein [Rhodospirillales bacterium]
MQHLDLLRVAGEAEWLRLRALARRQRGRALLAAGAGVFLLAALVLAHAALWLVLRGHGSALRATLLLGGGDLALALVLLAIAARSAPGSAERDALALREKAIGALLREADLLRLATALWRVARRR